MVPAAEAVRAGLEAVAQDRARVIPNPLLCLAVGLARVAWLKAEADKAASGTAPVKRAPEPQDTVPTPELLAAAAAGAVSLSKEQREWCVGEAMVVTGFQYTPVELIEKGDAAIARLILDARKSA